MRTEKSEATDNLILELCIVCWSKFQILIVFKDFLRFYFSELMLQLLSDNNTDFYLRHAIPNFNDSEVTSPLYMH